jgi:hypothetical protein
VSWLASAWFSPKNAIRSNMGNLVVSGDGDEMLLDALQDYVKRQKKRSGIDQSKIKADKAEAAN